MHSTPDVVAEEDPSANNLLKGANLERLDGTGGNEIRSFHVYQEAAVKLAKMAAKFKELGEDHPEKTLVQLLNDLIGSIPIERFSKEYGNTANNVADPKVWNETTATDSLAAEIDTELHRTHTRENK